MLKWRNSKDKSPSGYDNGISRTIIAFGIDNEISRNKLPLG